MDRKLIGVHGGGADYDEMLIEFVGFGNAVEGASAWHRGQGEGDCRLT
jgi:hypothetical protein